MVERDRDPSAWLSLDAGDNDPIRFLQYLLTAIQSIAPGIGDDLLGMLQGTQPAQYENVINLLANELASISDPFVLVLDDFHVIQSEAVLSIIYYLLEHLPHQKHLVLLTRIDPPLPLSRLRVRNQLLDIRADQLRFTHDEIAAFLNDVMGLTLSADDLSAMETRTEGWIAGLQLAALSMQSCKDIHGFVSAFTGSHHYIMDYLVEEVLRTQPRKVGAFLLQTSILDHMCGPLCEAVVDADCGWTCQRARNAGSPGKDEPLRHPAGQRTALVSLSPSLRGRPQEAPGTPVSAFAPRAASPRFPMVRAKRVNLRSHPAGYRGKRQGSRGSADRGKWLFSPHER